MNKVYLVGAGPGDPDLITWKGRQLLQTADAVLYDHLANDHLLDLTPSHCERLYVGKKKSDHAFSQEEIASMLIERARRGLTVVRLKGGDPFLFGRGGEEAEALADAGVPFEVVPGVTSPLGIAAYTGVPLTHREHTSVVTFVTGHDPAVIDWDRVGRAETLVILMGLSGIGEIARQMIARGRTPQTPAMAVRWGTRPDQQTIVGSLGDIAERVRQARLKPPATIIVGEVVGLREKLDWFEELPLFGQRIVVTRPREQSEDLLRRLRELGADAISVPAAELVPPADWTALDAAIENLEEFDWLIFTSVNGVRYFMERLDASARDLRSLRAKVCAIGPATAAALAALHLKVDLLPQEYVAESMMSAFAEHAVQGKRFLIPRASVARDVIPAELQARGAQVQVVAAYRNIVPANLAQRAAAVFADGGKPDWVTFTSSSTVTNFVASVGAERLRQVKIASIGPVTSATLREHGLTVDAEADEYTSEGLLKALMEFVQAAR